MIGSSGKVVPVKSLSEFIEQRNNKGSLLEMVEVVVVAQENQESLRNIMIQYSNLLLSTMTKVVLIKL